MEDDSFRSLTSPIYEEFKPHAGWITENDHAETLCLFLPGFSKELILEVQIDRDGNIRTSGQRTLDNRRLHWRRFQTEHRIPDGFDARGIRARFTNDTLYVTFPKLITEQPKPEPPSPVLEKKQVLERKTKEEEEEKEKMGRQSTQLVVNMVVAVIMLVVIGMYVIS